MTHPLLLLQLLLQLLLLLLPPSVHAARVLAVTETAYVTPSGREVVAGSHVTVECSSAAGDAGTMQPIDTGVGAAPTLRCEAPQWRFDYDLVGWAPQWSAATTTRTCMPATAFDTEKRRTDASAPPAIFGGTAPAGETTRQRRRRLFTAGCESDPPAPEQSYACYTVLFPDACKTGSRKDQLDCFWELPASTTVFADVGNEAANAACAGRRTDADQLACFRGLGYPPRYNCAVWTTDEDQLECFLGNKDAGIRCVRARTCGEIDWEFISGVGVRLGGENCWRPLRGTVEQRCNQAAKDCYIYEAIGIHPAMCDDGLWGLPPSDVGVDVMVTWELQRKLCMANPATWIAEMGGHEVAMEIGQGAGEWLGFIDPLPDYAPACPETPLGLDTVLDDWTLGELIQAIQGMEEKLAEVFCAINETAAAQAAYNAEATGRFEAQDVVNVQVVAGIEGYTLVVAAHNETIGILTATSATLARTVSDALDGTRDVAAIIAETDTAARATMAAEKTALLAEGVAVDAMRDAIAASAAVIETVTAITAARFTATEAAVGVAQAAWSDAVAASAAASAHSTVAWVADAAEARVRVEGGIAAAIANADAADAALVRAAAAAYDTAIADTAAGLAATMSAWQASLSAQLSDALGGIATYAHATVAGTSAAIGNATTAHVTRTSDALLRARWAMDNATRATGVLLGDAFSSTLGALATALNASSDAALSATGAWTAATDATNARLLDARSDARALLRASRAFVTAAWDDLTWRTLRAHTIREEYLFATRLASPRSGDIRRWVRPGTAAPPHQDVPVSTVLDTVLVLGAAAADAFPGSAPAPPPGATGWLTETTLMLVCDTRTLVQRTRTMLAWTDLLETLGTGVCTARRTDLACPASAWLSADPALPTGVAAVGGIDFADRVRLQLDDSVCVGEVRLTHTAEYASATALLAGLDGLCARALPTVAIPGATWIVRSAQRRVQIAGEYFTLPPSATPGACPLTAFDTLRARAEGDGALSAASLATAVFDVWSRAVPSLLHDLAVLERYTWGDLNPDIAYEVDAMRAGGADAPLRPTTANASADAGGAVDVVCVAATTPLVAGDAEPVYTTREVDTFGGAHVYTGGEWIPTTMTMGNLAGMGLLPMPGPLHAGAPRCMSVSGAVDTEAACATPAFLEAARYASLPGARVPASGAYTPPSTLMAWTSAAPSRAATPMYLWESAAGVSRATLAATAAGGGRRRVAPRASWPAAVPFDAHGASVPLASWWLGLELDAQGGLSCASAMDTPRPGRWDPADPLRWVAAPTPTEAYWAIVAEVANSTAAAAMAAANVSAPRPYTMRGPLCDMLDAWIVEPCGADAGVARRDCDEESLEAMDACLWEAVMGGGSIGEAEGPCEHAAVEVQVACEAASVARVSMCFTPRSWTYTASFTYAPHGTPVESATRLDCPTAPLTAQRVSGGSRAWLLRVNGTGDPTPRAVYLEVRPAAAGENLSCAGVSPWNMAADAVATTRLEDCPAGSNVHVGIWPAGAGDTVGPELSGGVPCGGRWVALNFSAPTPAEAFGDATGFVYVGTAAYVRDATRTATDAAAAGLFEILTPAAGAAARADAALDLAGPAAAAAMVASAASLNASATTVAHLNGLVAALAARVAALDDPELAVTPTLRAAVIAWDTSPVFDAQPLLGVVVGSASAAVSAAAATMLSGVAAAASAINAVVAATAAAAPVNGGAAAAAAAASASEWAAARANASRSIASNPAMVAALTGRRSADAHAAASLSDYAAATDALLRVQAARGNASATAMRSMGWLMSDAAARTAALAAVNASLNDATACRARGALALGVAVNATAAARLAADAAANLTASVAAAGAVVSNRTRELRARADEYEDLVRAFIMNIGTTPKERTPWLETVVIVAVVAGIAFILTVIAVIARKLARATAPDGTASRAVLLASMKAKREARAAARARAEQTSLLPAGRVHALGVVSIGRRADGAVAEEEGVPWWM